MQDEFINKVAQSGIITLNLEQFLPVEPLLAFDLKPFLWHEMVVKEKDFREALQNFDWSAFANAHVALYCSVDTIIPVWAFMLANTYLAPVVKSVFYGTLDQMKTNILCNNINAVDSLSYLNERVVIKGCGKIPIPNEAYVAITSKLMPVVKSLMYGEPCSTVPLFKRKKENVN